jgi:recombination protein RecT
METKELTTTKQTKALTAKSLFNQDNVKKKFEELLGKRASQFITSVLQIVSSNDLLEKADPISIYNAAATAATLDLPLNNNLGLAYIIPFNQKQKDGSHKTVAQFQIGYKGFKQLALRTGQFQTINTTDVREGEIKLRERLSGYIEFDWIQNDDERLKKKVIGYVSYFKLINGYEQTFYMTVEELKAHGIKYSQTFKKGFGLWKDDFDSMACKTVTKLNLSKNAPLSVEIQKAIVTDQGVINDENAEDVSYADHEVVEIDKESQRVNLMIEDAQNIQDLENIEKQVQLNEDQLDLFNEKKESLTSKRK